MIELLLSAFVIVAAQSDSNLTPPRCTVNIAVPPNTVLPKMHRALPSPPAGTRGKGFACIKLTAGKDGRVREAIVTETDNDDYARRVLADVKAMQFEPATRGGSPVSLTYVLHMAASWDVREAGSFEEIVARHGAEARKKWEMEHPVPPQLTEATDTRMRGFETTRETCEPGGSVYDFVNACGGESWTMREAWIRAVRRCLQLGVQPNPDCRGADYPDLLDHAVRNSDVRLTDWLIAHGVKSVAGSLNPWAALQSCGHPRAAARAAVDCEALLERLLQQGAEINYVDPRGATALSYAVAADNEVMVELLLKHGANPNLGGTNCASVLDRALGPDKEHTSALLEKWGAQRRNLVVRIACRVDELRMISH